jgi:hypothetical protein
MKSTSIAGVRIPDSKLAQAATELVRDTESDLLFHHEGFGHKPETTFGTVNDDVLALIDPKFKRTNFCSIILNSAWRE